MITQKQLFLLYASVVLWCVMEHKIICGDAIEELKKLPRQSVDVVFTSPNPPFFMKHDPDNTDMVGTETNTHNYVGHLLDIFAEVHGVLKDSGSIFVNMGDYYYQETGTMMGTPELFILNMMNRTWVLRNKLIWHRTEDDLIQYDKTRFRWDWEYILFFTKKSKGYYFYNKDYESYNTSIFGYPYRTPKKNEFKSGFPEEIIRDIMRVTVPQGGTILDPMAGTGTTALVAKKMNRNSISIDISERMCNHMKNRLGIVDGAELII